MNPDPPAGAAGSWRLGEWTVNRLGLGAMRLTGTEGALGTAADRAQSIRVLRRAIELGVNHIDTAAFYVSSLGPANELIRQALSPYPDDLVITTKVVPGRGALGEPSPATGPEQLRSQVVENLRQLGLDSLQVVNLRVLGPARLAEHFGALADLRAEGLIGHLGISAVRPDHLAEAQAIAPVVCVQNRYNLDEQMGGSGELMLLCGQQTIAFVPYFAIAGKGR
ncbi:MAG TPA: aldo/keto reductase, partial [Acidimicrobiales bacterium]|nr:aldo/keto reductase [Acidimicrobiales bacterium]